MFGGRLGARQRIGAAVTIPEATTGLIGTVNGMSGAFGILLRFSGGGSANILDVIALAAHDVGATGAASAQAGVWWIVPTTYPATNFTLPNASFVTAIHQWAVTAAVGNLPAQVLLPKVDVSASVAVGAVTGVNIDAWPIYPIGFLPPAATDVDAALA